MRREGLCCKRAEEGAADLKKRVDELSKSLEDHEKEYQVIRVSESFRIFSTIAVSKLDTSECAEGQDSLSVLWRRVMIQPPDNKDLQEIVKVRYPDMELLAGKLIAQEVLLLSIVQAGISLNGAKGLQAIDVFAVFSSSFKNRLSIMKEIAILWTVPVSTAETLYPHDKPIIQDSMTDLRIGRVSLQYTKKPVSIVSW
ncbi:hypothetical protein RIF29_38618 [Crotalaria pallida]|uniref:Uncharacterized protein n=1 Tax=Crotalaria pallida TaxID=3830 RepID=A0AAN9E1H4_CROPI